MAITVKYFGAVAEATGKTEESFRAEDLGQTINDLRRSSLKKYEALEHMTFQIAVNQSLQSSGEIKDGDEIALLPPFAGG